MPSGIRWARSGWPSRITSSPAVTDCDSASRNRFVCSPTTLYFHRNELIQPKLIPTGPVCTRVVRIASRLLSVVAGVLLATACGASPISAAGPSSRPAASTASPTVSVPSPTPSANLAGIDTILQSDLPSEGLPCGTSFNRFTGCHYSTTLAERLATSPVGPGNPVCRCQNPYKSVSWSVDTTGPTPVGHVVFVFGPTVSSRVDFVFTATSGEWEISDLFCTGQASSSIFSNQPGLCSG